jgi:phosphate transport system protein
MREQMEDRIREIHRKVEYMSRLSAGSIGQAMEAFVKQDARIAKQILAQDPEINRLEKDIENLCITLAATQSPLASDLRQMVSIIKIVTDLERIGDYSCNIAEVVIGLGKYELVKPLERLPLMERTVREMLNSSLMAYFQQNIELAYETARRDDEVDLLYEEIYRDLLFLIKERENLEDQIIGLILVGRYLERIADHATNICERVILMKTGENVKL